jgi:hypothetical protein
MSTRSIAKNEPREHAIGHDPCHAPHDPCHAPDPADLGVSWARNMVGFDIASAPAAEQEDGLSKFQTDNIVFRFYAISGEPISTPPDFLADMVLPRAM